MNIIREKGPVSRIEASRFSRLSIATTKRLVDELISMGMVAEGLAGEREGRGRKAASLRLNSRHGFAVGVNLEPGVLEVAGVCFTGERIYWQKLQPLTNSRDTLERLITEEARRAADACTAAGHGPLLGLGAGIAGLVDAREGVVLYCPSLPGWEGAQLGGLLRDALGVEAVVDDGVRCMALAEKRYGAARDLDTFLLIYIGTGVGSGIVLDNRIYRGRHGVSGEFGHITVKENGPLCKCGNRGCLEALVSTNAILARVRELIAAGVYTTLGSVSDPAASLTLATVGQAAIEGDKLANIVVAEIEESIGIGVADLINVFDPGTVILAGEVVEELHGLILEGIERIVRRRAMHAIAQKTAIVKSAFESDSGALGAATLVIERLLGNEILNL